MDTGVSNSRKDIAWKYAYLAEPNKKNDLTCNFCGKVAKGGAYRLKQHLAGNSTAITSCQKCPELVKEEVRQYMLKKKSEGKKQEEIQATANDAYKKESREKACVDLARWMCEAGIPFSAVNFDSFKVAIQSIGRYGIGMKPPSYDEVRVHITEILGTSVLVAGERSVRPDKLTEQPLPPKDARIFPVNPSPDAVIVGPSRDVTKQQESTEAVTVHPLNPNVSHEQNVSNGDGQYSPVATQLYPLMMDGPLYSPPQFPVSPSYYAQAPAPNLPHMSSAIPISPADLMFPENSSILGGNLSGNLGSSSLMSPVTYQPMGILEENSQKTEQISQQQITMFGLGLMSCSFGECYTHGSSNRTLPLKLRSKSGTEQGSSSVRKYVPSALGIRPDSYNQLDFVMRMQSSSSSNPSVRKMFIKVLNTMFGPAHDMEQETRCCLSRSKGD